MHLIPPSCLGFEVAVLLSVFIGVLRIVSIERTETSLDVPLAARLVLGVVLGNVLNGSKNSL